MTVLVTRQTGEDVVLASGGGTGQLTGLSGWAADVMTSLGEPGAGAIIALENIFPPVPSEVVLPLAGFLAGQGSLNLVAVIVWTTVGSVTGALVLYALGALLGRDRLRRVAAKVPLLRVDDVDRAEKWFARHGGTAVLVGRCVPVVRSLVSIPAGVERMPLGRFVAYTAVGSAVWNTALVLLGYALGSRWQQIGHYSSYINYAIIAFLVAAVLVTVVRRVRTTGRS